MRLSIYLLMIALISGLASANCIDAHDGMRITEDTSFCSRTYDLPNGIIIDADDIAVDCNTAVLRGDSQSGTGIHIEGRKNVVIKKCNIVTYKVGVYIKESSQISVIQNALLKNKIGIRLLNSYENTISENADKSTQEPLSVINSKFNVFIMENKNIDKEFCEENLCNKVTDINPCENDDFYCSDRCNAGNDNDCKTEQPAINFESKENTKKTTGPAETPTGKVVEPQKSIAEQPKKSRIGWLFYAIVYVIAFFMLQFYTYARQF